MYFNVKEEIDLQIIHIREILRITDLIYAKCCIEWTLIGRHISSIWHTHNLAIKP